MRLFCSSTRTHFCTRMKTLRSGTAWMSSMPRILFKSILWVSLLPLIASPGTLAASTSLGVSFEGVQATVAIGLGIPHATALDVAGNLYVTDLIDSQVLKIPRGATSVNCTVSGSCISLGGGFAQPTGVAVDANGTVFVTDASTQSLYKITAVGTQTTVVSGLASPSGIALASDGTAFVAVSNAILRITAAGVASTFATGPAQPGGVALGANGTLYVADVAGNQIVQFSPGGAQTTLATGLSAPQSIALDGAGNLYVTDTGNNRIVSVPAAGSGYLCPLNCTILAVQTSSPSGVSSDASGNLYVADTGHNQVVKLTQDAGFGTYPVAASNANPATSLILNYLLYSSSCASPPTIRVLTRGAAGKDFTVDPSVSVCSPGTPDSLSLTVNFAPFSPGLRGGSVEFIDSAGVTQVATYLHGIGKGPQITWTPGVVTNALTTPATP